MARLEGVEPPTLCFEGRCSIQLSYRRNVCFCNLITELAACDSDSLKLRFPRCAPFCARLAATWLRTSRLRKGECTETKFGFAVASDASERPNLAARFAQPSQKRVPQRIEDERAYGFELFFAASSATN